MRNPPLRTILVVLTLSHIVSSLGNYCIPPLTPFLREDLHLNHAQVGMLTSAFYLGVVCTSIPFGWVSDLLGERRVLVLGLGIQGVFLICFSWVQAFFIGTLFLFLAGIGYSSMNPATTKAVMSWFPPQGRATAMGVKQTGIPVGGILASSIVPSLALIFGWRTSIVFVGLTTLISISAAWLLLPPPSRIQGQRSAMRWSQLGEVLLNKDILALAIMGIFTAGVQLSIVTYLVLFLKSQFLFSTVLAGIYLAVSQVGGAVGRVCWGLISDFLGIRKRKPILLIIGIIATVQLILLSRLQPNMHILLYLVVALLGFTAIGHHGVLYSLIGELANKELVGLTTGFMLTITFLGIILFPPLFGHIVDRLGSYTMAWDFLALSCLAATLMLLFLVREKDPKMKNDIIG